MDFRIKNICSTHIPGIPIILMLSLSIELKKFEAI